MIEIIAAIGGAGTVAALIAVIVLALKLSTVSDRCADARVDATNKAGQLAIATSDVATWTTKAETERKRADGLDAILAGLSPGDVAAARAVVLAGLINTAVSRNHSDPAAGTGDKPVPDQSTPAAPGREGLIKPGD